MREEETNLTQGEHELIDLVERTATLLENLPEERIAPSLRNDDVTVNIAEITPANLHLPSPIVLTNTNPHSFKYDENLYLDEVKKYIEGTYNQHYASKDGSQAIDAIFHAGHGVGFCLGNIAKYTNRFGKKNGQNRVDILKLIHYAVLTLHALDLEKD